MNEINFGGCNESTKDKRTITFDSLSYTSIPFTTGGVRYKGSDILHQHKVGICTAISLIQNRNKANGKKYSYDFQYLLQKKFIDKNWFEGSSPLSSLKVGNKYGFLPINEWTYTTEDDLYLPYAEYIKKLQAIPDTEIYRLLSLCVDKIGGYAQVGLTPEAIAKAIDNSKAGVICRYEVSKAWYSTKSGKTSWKAKDISPLRNELPRVGGHQIIGSYFNYVVCNLIDLPNTWGRDYGDDGTVQVDLDKYSPTEVWAISEEPVIYKFEKDLKLGMDNDDVKNLQNALKIKGFFNYGKSTGFFGGVTWLAVKNYQKSNNIPNTGYIGVLTRTQLNKDFLLE